MSLITPLLLCLLSLAAPPEPVSLRLMTFNIRYDTVRDGADAWEHRKDFAAAVIRDSGADVVGLQEALRSQLDDLRRALPDYDWIGVGRDDGADGGEFSAILYRTARLTPDPEHQGTFWLSDTPETPGTRSWGNRVTRICTWARFTEGETGRGFFIFNTHLDHESQNSRARSAELIAARMGARPHPHEHAILMGDFNAGEGNPVVRYLTGDLPRASEAARDAPAPPPSLRLVNAFRAVHPDAHPVGTYHAFRGNPGGEMIDHIFIPARTAPAPAKATGAAILRTERNGRYPSDHFPVQADVTLLPPSPPSPPSGRHTTLREPEPAPGIPEPPDGSGR